ncbi:histidine phosphatase family protein [Kribbella soli]|uniref:Histidine phosphatase family protein n=1 Tax=Kribbella soli TaxID=1124743 RepID=A0A4R0HLD7_9ACTN|nr:histidine phosphatase family protein [Kribbella soli]TCC11581.1 histidine phosphatase family protein [Kribbella soli]
MTAPPQALTLVAHALTPALRGLVLGGDTEPDPASVEAASELKLSAHAVYAGPEQAAVRTAAVLGLDPVVEPALRDREYGEWTGRGLEELLASEPSRVAAWLERPHTATPGGETENDVLARVADWLGDLAAREHGSALAVVHPAIVRAIVLYVVDAPAESLRHVDVRPLATVNLSYHSGNWSLAFTP